MANRYFKVGSMATDDPSEIKTLWGWAQTTYYSGLFDSTTNAAYVVPAGKVFYVTRIKIGFSSGAGHQHVTIGYGTDASTLNDAGAPTGWVTSVGGTTINNGPFATLAGAGSASFASDFDTFISFTAGQYPTMLNAASGVTFGFEVQGIEVDA